MSEGLRLAVASAYPPNRGPLSEYAWHVVQALSRNPLVEHVHVLADRGQVAEPGTGRVTVHQCWSFGGIGTQMAVARAARRLRVHAVWFHLHMTSGGSTRLSQFANLLSPAACRAAGIPAIVTLHNMLGLTDLTCVYPGARRIDVLAGHLATALLGLADQVCVPLPEYAGLMRARYGIKAHWVPLGTPGAPLGDTVQSARRGSSILVFGRFGSYKRLEVVLNAMQTLRQEDSDLTLTIAGTDARRTPGYLQNLRARYAHLPNVEFVGYVPEADVPSLFQRASACVLPYATVTGMSSVAMQAAMYGVPIIASDIPGVRLFERQGLKISFFKWPLADSLTQAIKDVFAFPMRSSQDAAHNLNYCRSCRMDDVVGRYLELIEAVVRRRSPWPIDDREGVPAALRLR